MSAVAIQPSFDASKPIHLSSPGFSEHKYAWYRWMLEEAPVAVGKITVFKLYLVARYDDCRMVLTDERFCRNRSRATGRGKQTSPLPFPLPKSIALLAGSMIQQDDPEHRRLRNLVNKAFTRRAVGLLEARVESLSHDLLDQLEPQREVDLLEAYGRQIPTRVIAEMLGMTKADMQPFTHCLRVLTEGFTGLGVVRTLLWDLRRATRLVREMVDRKRKTPGDDILTALIEAEHEGDRLSEDELVGMVFLLVVAGYETTMHLIGNSVRALVEHPEVLEQLRKEPALWDGAVEELLRHRGPVHGTKMQWAKEDVTLHGVTIPKGSGVMPLLGAANQDPRVFENPDEIDITRSPNPHLGFGFGEHFCLGAQLARMETRVALRNLFERNPELRLAVSPDALEIVPVPGWHRHAALPVVLR